MLQKVSKTVFVRRRPTQVRLHPLDVRVTLKGGLSPGARAEVARVSGSGGVEGTIAVIGQLDDAKLAVDAL